METSCTVACPLKNLPLLLVSFRQMQTSCAGWYLARSRAGILFCQIQGKPTSIHRNSTIWRRCMRYQNLRNSGSQRNISKHKQLEQHQICLVTAPFPSPPNTPNRWKFIHLWNFLKVLVLLIIWGRNGLLSKKVIYEWDATIAFFLLWNTPIAMAHKHFFKYFGQTIHIILRSLKFSQLWRIVMC